MKSLVRGSRLLLPTLGGVLLASTLSFGQTGTWTSTGEMTQPRRDHTATLLPDDKVLIVGWLTADADLYDPASGTFTPIGQTLSNHGQGLTATPLSDGRVLIVGGTMAPQGAEIYDPVTGTFSATGSLNVPRFFHSATLLGDGRVLIAAGERETPYATPPPESRLESLTSSEIYDPATGQFALTGSLYQGRDGHTAALLQDGRVLIAGGTWNFPDRPGYGTCLASAEIYDPASGTFSTTGSMLAPRCSLYWPGAPVLANGKVLIAGNAGRSAELFDPATGTFNPTGEMISERGVPSLTLLADGRVLVAGGYRTNPLGGNAISTASAEIYDPITESFTAAATMNASRQQHAAILLASGAVLVSGGFDFAVNTETASAELFTPPARTYAGAVSGTIYYSTTPLAGIVVQLGQDPMFGAPLQTTTTNANGHYGFADVPPGSYWIKRIGPSGYIGWVSDSVTVADVPIVRDLDLPKVITLLAPANGSVIATPHPTLTWTSNPEAENAAAEAYRIQINETETWNLLEIGRGPVSSYTVQGALVPGTSYTWQVDAYDAGGHWVGTTPMQFTFIAPSPQILGWVSGTIYYSTTPLAGITVELFQGETAVQSTTTDGNGWYSFTGVAPGSYVVRRYGPPGYIGWAGTPVFINNVPVVLDLDLPKVITLLSPGNATTVTTAHPLLTWTPIPEADGLRPEAYRIQINETSGWNLLEIGQSPSANYTVQHALVPGTSYTWQVDAYDPFGHWVGTTPVQFTFIPPPSQNFGGISGIVYYSTTALPGIKVDLFPATSPNDPPLQTTTTDSTGDYKFYDVAPGDYWLVVYGPPGHIERAAFPVTVADTPVIRDLDSPKSLLLLTPADGSSVADAHPTLTWVSNPEAEGSRPNAYRIQINELPSWSLVEEGQSSASSYVMQGALAPGKQYVWIVNAYDAADRWVGLSMDSFTFVTPVPTPAGEQVQVTDATGDVLVKFDTVTEAGVTSIGTSPEGPQLPAGFQLGNPPTYFELSTTAVYSGQIRVCIDYTGVSYTDPSTLRLFHYEDPQWLDVTTDIDPVAQIICGVVTSLSPFAVVQGGDTTAPIIHVVGATPNRLWPPNHQMVPVTITAAATDDLDPNPRCTIANVSSNQPPDGLGNGDRSPDWQITGPRTVNLRAERAGKGPDRIYTLAVTCMDASGNKAHTTTTVSVPHDKSKR